jgi:glucoamylase
VRLQWLILLETLLLLTSKDFYTWTRDSALTLKMIVDEFIFGRASLQTYIEDYIHAQAVLQTVANPSGAFLPTGRGLGEPKYNVDGTRFNGAWGRPQRDGPALRAISLITYCNWLGEHGQKDKAKTIVWPIISNDLSYVGQYWLGSTLGLPHCSHMLTVRQELHWI